MTKEEALVEFESFYRGDESRDLIESIYAHGFVIVKPEAPLKIHIEAMDMSGFNKKFIKEKLASEIIESLKYGYNRKELKNALL